MRLLDATSDAADDAAFQRALQSLPSVQEQAKAEVLRLFVAHAAGVVDWQSIYAICEEITDEVVDKFNLAVGGEDNAIRAWNTVYADLLEYVTASYPTA